MRIEINKWVINKTWKYLLYPVLHFYGATFIAKYNGLFKLGAGIYDGAFNGKDRDKRLLFVLFDKKVKASIFSGVLEYFRNSPYYYKDYAYDDMATGRMHMVVFTIPEELYTTYDLFIKGEYSKMFTPEEIEKYFKTAQEGQYDVLTRTDVAYEKMIQRVHDSFGSTITKQDLIGAELDFPPCGSKAIHNEVFNYDLIAEGVK